MVSPTSLARIRKERNLDENWDWRTHGIFQDDPPAQREYTGWAYASVTAVEANLQIHGYTTENLSVQNLIDCCFVQGGIKRKQPATTLGALGFIRDHGIATATQYPTLLPPDEAQGKCKRCPCMVKPNVKMEPKVMIKKACFLRDKSERGLMTAIQKTPLIVTINIDDQFNDYKKDDNVSRGKGIYARDVKDGNIYQHHLILLGYDTEKGGNGEPGEGYWILRNSYGTSWGDNGYMKLHRDQTSKFDIAVYPDEAYNVPDPAPAPAP